MTPPGLVKKVLRLELKLYHYQQELYDIIITMLLGNEV